MLTARAHTQSNSVRLPHGVSLQAHRIKISETCKAGGYGIAFNLEQYDQPAALQQPCAQNGTCRSKVSRWRRLGRAQSAPIWHLGHTGPARSVTLKSDARAPRRLHLGVKPSVISAVSLTRPRLVGLLLPRTARSGSQTQAPPPRAGLQAIDRRRAYPYSRGVLRELPALDRLCAAALRGEVAVLPGQGHALEDGHAERGAINRRLHLHSIAGLLHQCRGLLEGWPQDILPLTPAPPDAARAVRLTGHGTHPQRCQSRAAHAR